MTTRGLSTNVITRSVDGAVGQPRDHAQDSAESNMPEERRHGFLGPSEEQANAKDRHGDHTTQEPDPSHEGHAPQPTRAWQVGTDNQKSDREADSAQQEVHD